MKKFLYVLLIALISIIIFGCAKKTDKGPLSVGLMPAVDSAPFFYAEKQGYFEKEGISVELTVYTSAQNRQTALQANRIDGAMTDLVALIINKSEGFPVKGTMSTDGVFALLKNPAAGTKTKPLISMMEISVSNYLAEKYMAEKEYEKTYIAEIPTRLQAVLSGAADMGLFPEPIASIGELQGLEKSLYPGIPSESLDIMVFTEKALKEKKKSLEIFHMVYAKAASELAADENLARDLLPEYIANIPPAAINMLIIPEFGKPSLPSEDFVKEIETWTSALTGQEISVSYDDMFDDRFLK